MKSCVPQRSMTLLVDGNLTQRHVGKMLGIVSPNAYMCEARAQHHCQYEVAESLLRFNCVLQRAMHWMPETTHEDTVRIHCRVHTWTDGYWKRYAQEVRGYHSGHFAAALQDALQLASTLRNLEEFRKELVWLQVVLLQLPITQQSMQSGDFAEDKSDTDSKKEKRSKSSSGRQRKRSKKGEPDPAESSEGKTICFAERMSPK